MIVYCWVIPTVEADFDIFKALISLQWAISRWISKSVWFHDWIASTLWGGVSESETMSFGESATKGPDAAFPLISSVTWNMSFSLFPFRNSAFVMWKYTVLGGMICEDKLSKRCKMHKPTGGQPSYWVSLPEDIVQIPPKVLTDN